MRGLQRRAGACGRGGAAYMSMCVPGVGTVPLHAPPPQPTAYCAHATQPTVPSAKRSPSATGVGRRSARVGGSGAALWAAHPHTRLGRAERARSISRARRTCGSRRGSPQPGSRAAVPAGAQPPPPPRAAAAAAPSRPAARWARRRCGRTARSRTPPPTDGQRRATHQPQGRSEGGRRAASQPAPPACWSPTGHAAGAAPPRAGGQCSAAHGSTVEIEQHEQPCGNGVVPQELRCLSLIHI